MVDISPNPTGRPAFNSLAKVEVKEELEPPDEVLSSPYSILKARPKPAPVPAVAAKVGPIREQ